MSERMRILLVEDNPGDADLIRELLAENGTMAFEIECAPRLAIALEHIEVGGFDVILLDLDLPDSFGLDTVNRIHSQAVNIPIVVMTGNNEPHTGLAAIQAGSQDYLVKGQVNAALLIHILRYAIERHQNAYKLMESEQKYRAVVDQASDGIVIAQDGVIKFANISFASMLGYEIGEVEGFELIKFASPENLGLLTERLENRLAGGKPPARDESFLLHKNGTKIQIELTSSIIQYDGKPAGLVNLRDITDRKRMEKSLQLSEQRFRSLIAKVSNIAIQGYSEDGNVIFWNKASEDLYGYSAAEAIGHNLIDLIIPPEMQTLVKESVQTMIATGQVRPAEELSLMRKDGSRISVFSSHTVIDVAGLGRELYCIDVDLTERKRAEDALRRSEALLSEAQRIGQMGHWEWSAPASDFIFSEEVARILDLSPDMHSVSQQTIANMLSTDERQRLRELDRKTFAEHSDMDYEYCITLQDGKKRWIHQLAKIFYTDEGQPTRMMGIIQDITHRKLVEIELLEHRDHLEELVKVRTDALVEARDQAEAANHAKSDFLAMMSHEIRTPLNGVLGLAHLLLQTGVTEKQRDYLTSLQMSGESLLTTINDILDFSKIESGKLSLEATNFDLNDVLQRLSSVLAHRAQQNNLQLIFKTSPGIPRVLVGDPSRLGQVLINLVGNAIKFTKAGRVVVKTTLLKHHAQQATLEFSVQDTGIGITENQLAQLFQPFTQADSSISRKYGGSGLGLTISQRLVQIMGGEIRVESQPGLGSLFTFALTLPCQDVRLEQDPKLLVVNSGELNGKRVLVVEDNQINQMVALDTLKNMGMQVTLANSGEEALELVKQQQFDAILMDIQMPGMDGYQTTAQIRLDPSMSQSQLPIIAMTAHALQGDRQKALQAGLNDYISKPVDVAQLASVLLRWVKPRPEKALEASQTATHPESPGSNQSRSGIGAGDDLPVTLDSINMEGALTRLGGNRKLYRRLLQMFQDEHANKIQTIQGALKNDDIELARLLVHSLKGVAGTIGADELIAATKQLELSIAEGKNPINDQRLALVEQKLTAVLTSIETLNMTRVNAETQPKV